MKDTIKSALITGVFGIAVAIITGIFTYKAGGEEVEQRIDNQVSQVVAVDNGDVDAAVGYLVSRVEDLEDENELLKAQLDGSSTGIGNPGTDSGSGTDGVDDAIEKVDIFTFLPFKEGREQFIYSSGSQKDNVGNSYPAGYYITYDGQQNKNSLVCYILDGKYSTLHGQIAIAYGYKDVKEEVWVEFYNGDTLIKRTDSVYSGIKPVEFSVDVTQVEELTIRINGGSQRSGILTQGFYLEQQINEMI